MTISKVTPEEAKQYLKRFEGTVPLVIYPQSPYPRKCQPTFIESEINLEYGLYQIQNIEPNKQYKIIAGFEKARLEDFVNFDWLMGGGGIPDLFNKRLVDKMQKVCPNDFIALPVTLINLSDKVEPYQNNDFYVVNASNTIDAIDREKSKIHYYNAQVVMGRVKKKVYKEDPWQGHLIAFDSIGTGMIYHPKLAKELYPSKQFTFLTPEEDNYWHGEGFAANYNKDTWLDWLRTINTMTYPGSRLLKSADWGK